MFVDVCNELFWITITSNIEKAKTVIYKSIVRVTITVKGAQKQGLLAKQIGHLQSSPIRKYNLHIKLKEETNFNT